MESNTIVAQNYKNKCCMRFIPNMRYLFEAIEDVFPQNTIQ